MRGLKKLRRLSGLTQAQLSRLSGIDRSKLSLAETGHLEISDNEQAVIRCRLMREIAARSAKLSGFLSVGGNEDSKKAVNSAEVAEPALA